MSNSSIYRYAARQIILVECLNSIWFDCSPSQSDFFRVEIITKRSSSSLPCVVDDTFIRRCCAIRFGVSRKKDSISRVAPWHYPGKREREEEVIPSSFLPIFHIGAKQLTHPLPLCYLLSIQRGSGAWRIKRHRRNGMARIKKEKKKKKYFVFFTLTRWSERRINYFL